MSLITRCPACSTVFKVVADQLKVSGGWVRCGHCSEVFDAQTALQGDAALLQGQVAVAGSSALANVQVANNSAAATPGEATTTTGVMATAGSAPESVLPSGPFSELPAPSSEDFDSSYFERPRDLQDVSFVREARRQAAWRRPAVRVALAMVSLVLLLALAAQVAVFERDRIAATEPRARPFLAALCEPFNCKVEPLRQLDALAIDSSSFNKLRPDTYRLSVAIKNTGPLALAMPSLDLALTDTQDQAVIRRVVTPTELGAGATLAAQGEFTGSITLQVQKSPDGSAVAGYRVAAFYP